MQRNKKNGIAVNIYIYIDREREREGEREGLYSYVHVLRVHNPCFSLIFPKLLWKRYLSLTERIS